MEKPNLYRINKQISGSEVTGIFACKACDIPALCRMIWVKNLGSELDSLFKLDPCDFQFVTENPDVVSNFNAIDAEDYGFNPLRVYWEGSCGPYSVKSYWEGAE